jgi:hypothetical protein
MFFSACRYATLRWLEMLNRLVLNENVMQEVNSLNSGGSRWLAVHSLVLHKKRSTIEFYFTFDALLTFSPKFPPKLKTFATDIFCSDTSFSSSLKLTATSSYFFTTSIIYSQTKLFSLTYLLSFLTFHQLICMIVCFINLF